MISPAVEGRGEPRFGDALKDLAGTGVGKERERDINNEREKVQNVSVRE